MKQIILGLFLSFFSLTCVGQTNYPTRDSIHIFWQPNLKITYGDYKGQTIPEVSKLMAKYQFSASASVGLWSTIDIPKKKKDRYTKFEKVYFAPAFERTTSFAKSNDSLQIEMQNIYLDFCEVWARWARKELKTIQDSTNATGTLSIFYLTVKQEMEERQHEMYRAYFNDVFIDKKDGAFAMWRTNVNKLLEETKQWATSPEECYRLMAGRPIVEGYIQAPKLIGPMRKEEKY